MSLQLSNKQIDLLQKQCANAENAGSLTAPILNMIYDQKWFKIFIPKAWGGLELTLPEALKLEEQLAYIDGSLGWTITLCAGANLFAGYIDPSVANTIFSTKKVCFGGSGAASGEAILSKNGYLINGTWNYATGAPHLTHFTANCVIKKDGKMILTKEGAPLIRSFFFKKSEVSMHKNWHTMGLKATSGDSFSVNNLFVKHNRSFIIDPQTTTHGSAIYRYPFMPLAESTIAINTLGMTRHFLDEALSIVQQKSSTHQLAKNKIAIQAITKAANKINPISIQLYDMIEQSWQQLVLQKDFPQNDFKKIGRLCRQLVTICRTEVAAIYPYCGLGATQQTSTINRIFRDIFTASQHGLLTYKS